MSTPTPSVTILDNSIKDVAAYAYPGNPVETAVARIAREIVIAVFAPDFDPFSHIGALTRVAPCEYVLAVVESCVVAIE
eukprot:9730989-Lingulodinium_polyedra.AAC.1